jgi:hypothetical protein
MHHENLDYERHCKYQIDEFVQAHEEPTHTNTNASRSLDCIYLRPMDNAQGGHELLHLPTNKVIKRRNLTKVPITSSIIKQVHALAELDEMPRGLKITNRANQVVFKSAWIAGVDYDEELFDDDIDDDYHEEENNEENENENENNDHYDEMDENDMADILQQPNNVPHETENEHEIVFEEANHTEELQEEEVSSEYEDDDYEPGNDEDISLEADDNNGEEEDDQGKRRTGRVRVPPTSWQHLQAREDNTEHYSSESAQIIAMTMVHYNTELIGINDTQASSFLQTYSLKQGIKKFGEQGIKAVHKEMKQIHDRVVFEPISIEKMTILERKRAMESLIFLTEKREKTIKARVCANGSTQRAYIAREEASSPTAASEAILITGVIDAK